MEVKRMHLNKPQLRSGIIGAHSEMVVAGRGTGKSEMILAPKSANCYLGTMPRGIGVIVNATYSQALSRTFPALKAGWDKMGYIKDKHYIIGHRPPQKWIKQWNWKGPWREPEVFKYFISWWNGAGAHLVSQERSGSSNGITIDWIIGDEAKLLNNEKLKTELFPANRGLVPEFSNTPYHHGITFTTDMPTGSSGRWIFDLADGMDRQAINDIWGLQLAKFKLNQFLKSERVSVLVKKEIEKQIQVIDDELIFLRRDLMYYHEASTLDNIHALGLAYIKQQMLITSAFNFDTQILNIRPLKMEDGFYPDFEEEVHGYFSESRSYFDNTTIDYLNPTFDCRKDADLDTNAPLHMGWDYNRRIHPLAIAQVYKDELRVVKGIASLYPAKLKEAIDMFNAYYKPHNRRMIYYWFDHTAIGDQHDTTIKDDVVNGLRAAGWIVQEMYIGQQPTHEERYRMWGNLLTENGTYAKRFTINRENCDKMILSICQTQAEQRKNGFGKDKRTEADPNFPADESTHYTDALDTVVFGILESGIFYDDVPATSSIIITS